MRRELTAIANDYIIKSQTSRKQLIDPRHPISTSAHFYSGASGAARVAGVRAGATRLRPLVRGFGQGQEKENVFFVSYLIVYGHSAIRDNSMQINMLEIGIPFEDGFSAGGG